MVPAYPIAPRTDLVEILHGTPVADPFRTLEDSDHPATVAWVDAENALTRRLLDLPERDAIVERLGQLHRHARSSVPAVRGRRLFFTHNDGTSNQPVLEMAEVNDRAPGAEPLRHRRVLADPNALDAKGTTAITAFEPDERGERVVYAVSRGGSDRQELRVHDVAGARDLPDRLEWAKFASIAWMDHGFFYTRFPTPGTVPPEHEQYFCRLWFHRLGDPQSADRLVYERPDEPQVVFEVDVTSDAAHLVITSRRGASDKSDIHVVRLKPTPAPDVSGAPRALVTGLTDGWHFIDGKGTRLYFLTDAGAPLGRIVCFDLASDGAAPETVLPANEDRRERLQSAVIADGRLIVASLRNASSHLHVIELDGRFVRDIELPGIGSIVGLAGEWDTPSCFATFSSYTMPPRIFACDLERGCLVDVEPSPLPVDPHAYVTEHVWYPSGDGTPVSMFLIRRGLESTPVPRPVLLGGYGGFNISLTPSFDPSDFLWLDRGGLIAVAHLRGGGEYGEAWHQAGMLERKQNVFDDFIAAAQWLLETRRASPGQIAIEGGSNGGLLVGAVMVQRPDLFGAVICRVPVADMLRYHLFTVGRFWIPEYGCADIAEQFACLHRYSPYHNVADGVAYPPALILTADTDDRVAPGMAKKFAARLQEAAAPEGGPILLRVEHRAGHGAGKPLSKQIDEQADICTFLFRYLATSAGTPASEPSALDPEP